MTIDIYESTTDNIIFNEPSSPNNHSPKNSERDMYGSRNYGNSPSNYKVSPSPFAFRI